MPLSRQKLKQKEKKIMAVQTLTFENDALTMGAIIEQGLIKQGYVLAADARIKTAADPVGVGPVAYKGKLKDADMDADKEGYPRDMVALFFTDVDVKRAELFERADPADITDTIADYLANRGGDIATMLGNAPVIA